MDLLASLEDLAPAKLAFEDTTQVIVRRASSSSSSDSEASISGSQNPSAAHQAILDKLNRMKAKLSADTQVIESSGEPVRASRLPQLEIDLSEIKNSVLFPNTDVSSTQAVQNDTQAVEPTIEEKTRLAAEKIRQARLQKEELIGEISMTTLTDEEADFYDKPQSSSKQKKQTEKELREADQFLSSKKKQNFFDSNQVKTTRKFTKSDFINDFEAELTKASESDMEEPAQSATPSTSPHKHSSPIKVSNPIVAYSNKLKKQFTEINLESSESDNESSSVPELSKDLKLAIKKKFSKASPVKTKKTRKHFFNKLFASNINQLQELRRLNPDSELLEEMEKDEEVMGSLLEREIERARNIRKREKMKERAQQALLAKTSDQTQASPQVSDEEVPDSDNFDESEQDSGESEDDDDKDDDSSDEFNSKRRHAKVVDSEAESDIENSKSHFNDDEAPKSQESSDESSQSEDSYMFGYSETKGRKLTNSIKIDKISVDASLGTQLFQNLEPHKPAEPDNSFDLTKEASFFNELPSFQDLPPSQLKSTQILPDTTQADVTTQKDEATQNDNPTQSTQSTQILNVSTAVVNNILPNIDEDEEEDEEITPEALKKGRKLVRQNVTQPMEDSEDENEDEKIQYQIRIYEEKIRRKELSLQKRRKEMERKGMKDIIEGEAEESDDEWKGIGGADGEFDDRANSEDEKMIDNNFNIDLNDEEVKKKFMEQYQIKDQKELEKLIDDIKNHKLSKRFKNYNGLDIELSDEEDELLMAYRRQKLQEQKLKLLENAKLQKLTKSEKAKAFFNSIEEETVKIAIDEEKSEDESDDVEAEVEENEDKENEIAKKPAKKIRIQQSFIQKQLSFLTNSVDEHELAERISNRQHDLNYDSDDEIDLKSLKMQSLNNLRSMTLKRTVTEIETDNDDDETQRLASDDELLPSRKPSFIKSFKSTPSDSSLSFSGVTISKQYKAASGSKAAITYISKTSSTHPKSLKRIKHQKSINKLQHQNNMKKLFNSNNFN